MPLPGCCNPQRYPPMQVSGYDVTGKPLPPCAATIGFFDGVHLGHRFLLGKVVEAASARGIASAVVTFSNHPRTVTGAGMPSGFLTTHDEKIGLLAETGIDECFVIDFSRRIAGMPAREFMASVLKERFNVAVLVVGYDHRFGKGRLETFEDYERYGRELGIEVVRACGMNGGTGEVSSSLIRKCLASGNIRRAAMALGRNYSIAGEVVEGCKSGRKMGYPTANINVVGGKLLPARGVYAATARIGGNVYGGMLNIGVRPTFGEGLHQTAEMHLFDFSGNIYGKVITVEFIERIRDEREFGSVAELAKQLEEDERRIRAILFVEQNSDADPHEAALRAAGGKAMDHAYAARQITGARIARRKLPLLAGTKGIVYPARLSMEQCSSQLTAEFKATLAGGKSLVDLTGGFGIDCMFMSRKFEKAVYVERDSTLCSIMRHNASVLGFDNIEVVNADASTYLAACENANVMYIDPSRRDGLGRKMSAIGQCEPDLGLINDTLLSKCGMAIAKLSPMLDLSAAISGLRGVTEAYVIAAGGECKELLLVMRPDACGDVEVKAVDLSAGGAQVFAFTQGEEEASTALPATGIEAYLYEPNPAVMKAGAFKTVSSRFSLAKLSANTHLYTSPCVSSGFPGRCFKVIAVYDFSKSGLRELSHRHPRANISARNFSLSPDELRKRLRIADGGGTYIFATTLANRKRVLVVASRLGCEAED